MFLVSVMFVVGTTQTLGGVYNAENNSAPTLHVAVIYTWISTVRGWRDSGVCVYVSEFEAPDDFRVIWEKERKIHVDGAGSHKTKIERLFK